MMDKASSGKSTFVTQAVILASAGIIVRFIGFLYRLPLTSLIGDEGNDIYSSGYLLYTFFLILSSAGLPAAISKMVSERMSHNEFKSAYLVFRISLFFSSALGLIIAIVLAIFARRFSLFVESPDSYLSVIVLAPTIFIVSVMSVYRGFFQGLKNTVPTAISQIIEQIFNAVFSLLLAYLLVDKGVEYAAAGGNAGTSIGALAGLLSLLAIYKLYTPIFNKYKKDDRLRYSASINPARAPARRSQMSNVYKGQIRSILLELIKTALPIIVGTAIFSMTNLIDLKMVKSLLNASGVFTESDVSKMYGQLTGKYVLITTLPVALATAMSTAIVPSLAASAVKKEKKQVSLKIRMAFKLTMIIAIPAAVGIGLLGDQILLMLFSKYSAGGMLLKVGSVSIIFLSLTQIATGVLQGIGHVRTPAVAAFIGSAIKIPLNIVLVSNPSINVIGAVISTTVCYVVASVIDIAVLTRATGHRLDIIGVFIKPLAASGVMALGCYVSYYVIMMLIGQNSIACTLSILIGIVIYMFVMLLINGFTPGDLNYIPFGSRIAARLYK